MTQHYNLSELAQQAQARADQHRLEERVAVLEAALLDIQRECGIVNLPPIVSLYRIGRIVEQALGGLEE